MTDLPEATSPDDPQPTIERLQSGVRSDELALSTVYQAHRAELFAFLVRMTRDRETAEDLLQDTCPAPQQQVVPPVVSASVGNGQVVAATRGSYTTMTCSTTGTADAAPTSPGESLAAYPGDTITFTVPVGWRFVRWEGSHQPLRGTGGSVWQPMNLLDRPRSIQLPGPLLFDERVSMTVVLVSDDERSVIEMELQILVNQAVS
jgi:hypothetical protein